MNYAKYEGIMEKFVFFSRFGVNIFCNNVLHKKSGKFQ